MVVPYPESELSKMKIGGEKDLVVPSCFVVRQRNFERCKMSFSKTCEIASVLVEL